jgi:hypothetical protein
MTTTTTQAPAHRILEIVEKPASGPGALDGYEAVCSCGHRVGSSLRGLAAQWGREHAAYMSRKASGRR